MSVLAVADLSLSRTAPTRRGPAGRPRATARLRALPADPASSVTVTITLGTPGSEESERVLAALRDLLAAAGPGADIALDTPTVPDQTPPPAAGGLRLSPRPRTVTLDGRPLDLSRLEYELLLFLAHHPRQVFSRSQLLGHVWGHTHTTVRTVDVHVSRLRTKLGNPDIVTTVYGVGYRLSEEATITIDES
ncbi:winged helix-turn-helix domain-containing protein [Couchioplanes caeruleus]|uniref:winged helix-turn-helix domain-containing protein n=1 Tax=Couchioplanes caeruleus TaxID=56438 RepID=UPI0020BD9BF9|nr:winged helix-turn-helix domain-containing protein [Couchioplanes caeruleus]UQU66755.1 winged helix-turn-helix domain-containing protein [Couchioplanes caeruleus]